jgi:hypothetical protein
MVTWQSACACGTANTTSSKAKGQKTKGIDGAIISDPVSVS